MISTGITGILIEYNDEDPFFVDLYYCSCNFPIQEKRISHTMLISRKDHGLPFPANIGNMQAILDGT